MRRVRLAGARGPPVGVVKTRSLSLQAGPTDSRSSFCRSLCSLRLLGAEAGDEVEVDVGGAVGVGVFAEPVDGDAAEPVDEVVGDGDVCGGDRETAVAVGDLRGEFVGGYSPGGAVDADAFAGAVGGEDVAGGFPAAVLAPVDGSSAVGASLLALGGGHRAASSRWR